MRTRQVPDFRRGFSSCPAIRGKKWSRPLRVGLGSSPDISPKSVALSQSPCYVKTRFTGGLEGERYFFWGIAVAGRGVAFGEVNCWATSLFQRPLGRKFKIMFRIRQPAAISNPAFAGLVRLTARLGLLGLLLPLGCNQRSYSTVRVSGKVTYEDGSLIPASRIHITFVPQADPRDPKTHPRAGQAEVDTATGEFHSVNSLAPNDGIVVGDHKVLIQAIGANGQLAVNLVPEVNGSEGTTPLKVNSSESPFDFKIPKP